MDYSILWCPLLNSRSLAQLFKADFQVYGDSQQIRTFRVNYLEGKVENRGLLLTALYADSVESITDSPEDVYEAIYQELTRSPKDLNKTIHHIPDLQKVSSLELKSKEFKHVSQVKFRQKKCDLFARINKKGDRVSIELEPWIPGIEHRTIELFPFFAHLDGWLVVYRKPDYFQMFQELNFKTKFEFSLTHVEKIKQLVELLERYVDVETDDALQLESQQPEGVGQEGVLLEKMGNFLIFKPFIDYEEGRFFINKTERIAKDGQVIELDEEAKVKLYDFLEQFFPNGRNLFAFNKSIDEIFDEAWIYKFMEAAADQGIEIYGLKELDGINLTSVKPSVSINVKSGIDWFTINVEMDYDGDIIKTKEWIRAIRENRNYVHLSDGSRGMLPKAWVDRLRKVLKISDQPNQAGSLEVPKTQFNLIAEEAADLLGSEVRDELKERRQQLLEWDGRKQYEVPTTVQATLRDYQYHGFQWLQQLHEIGWNGILADDMGLGKTLQVLTHLAKVQPKQEAPSLIIMPRSLLFNWLDEIEKFCPELQPLLHHGSQRPREVEVFRDYDLILTTYGTAALDAEWLKEFVFHYVVLDESQAIKNVRSQRYQKLLQLRSHHRICMTGTPIENHTFELYAQMNFLNRKMLGSQKHFRDYYARPIDQQGDEEAALRLKKLIQPFLLRRTKEDVARDLPEKTESVLYCEMEDFQRELYDRVRIAARDKVLDAVEEQGVNQSKFMVLEALTKLRQICNATELVDPTLPKKKRMSAKMDRLLHFCEEELGDHNVLVFSQFTSMLKLIAARLDERQLPYCYLDGSTRDRKQVVRDFNEKEDHRIFLISLKAGNTGLNLVKADYVFLVDPWWNPAVESQAIDRTHRIGQTKHVIAYKMICKDSIEEKILQLQQKKQKVAGDIVRAEENVFKQLDKAELIELFG